MKKGTKMTIATFVLLVLIAVPVYFYMRQNTGSEELVQIKGLVTNPSNMTYGYLKTLPQVTEQITLTSGNNPVDNGVFTYTGVSLFTLLEQANMSDDAASVYVQAADGYGITIPIQDVIQNEKAFLAYERNGELLKSITDGGEGPFRLIIATDQFAQRWIRGVAIIEVR